MDILNVENVIAHGFEVRYFQQRGALAS
jgi:hypothetical protein